MATVGVGGNCIQLFLGSLLVLVLVKVLALVIAQLATTTSYTSVGDIASIQPSSHTSAGTSANMHLHVLLDFSASPQYGSA